MSTVLSSLELLGYSAILYGFRWLNNDIVLRTNCYYSAMYIVTELIINLKNRYYDEHVDMFKIVIKIMGFTSTAVLAIFIVFDTQYYIPVMFMLACLFLIIQTMTIINLSFDLTMRLVEKHVTYIVGSTMLGYLAIISYCVYHLVLEVNIFIIVHLIMLLVFSTMSIRPEIQANIPCSGLLSTVVVGLQATFFLIGSMSSGTLNETVMIVGLIVNILTLIRGILKHAMAWNHPVVYHSIILLSLFYIASILTNWNSTSGIYDVGKSEVGFWIKISCSWFTFLLYGWCLIAPVIFKNRDFGYI
eukprot:NODE_367_length_10044_cov_0.769432.p5 type:complete len:302 gc:universal NODE_367_length_10044_cov_0.769432:1056-151(-)